MKNEIVKKNANGGIIVANAKEIAMSLNNFALCFGYKLNEDYVSCLIDLFEKYSFSKYDFQEAYEKMMIKPKSKNYGMPSPSDWLECVGLLDSAEMSIESKYQKLREGELLC